MSEPTEDINYDFNYNMFLTKTMLPNLQSMNDRQKCVRWMRKLAVCNRTVNEMKLRNDFMYYLVLNVQNGELKPPFTDAPPTGQLPTLAHLLPGADDPPNAEAAAGAAWAETSAMARGKPMIYQRSPDGGAFLAAQPVPRCGAFCYLAVVSRSKSNPDK